METSEANTSFGLPPVGAAPPVAAQPDETHAQKMTRLRLAAEAQAAREFDEPAMFQKLLAEARAKRAAELERGVELPVDTQGFPTEYVKVMIFKGQAKHDLSYVPLSINGFCIKAPRGIEIILPKAFVDGPLNHAVENVTVQSQGGLISRPAHRFPYNTLGTATPAEYQAFQSQQRDLAQRQTAQVPA